MKFSIFFQLLAVLAPVTAAGDTNLSDVEVEARHDFCANFAYTHTDTFKPGTNVASSEELYAECAADDKPTDAFFETSPQVARKLASAITACGGSVTISHTTRGALIVINDWKGLACLEEVTEH